MNFSYTYLLNKSLYFFIALILFLTGCTTTQPINGIDEQYASDIKTRNTRLARLDTWEIKGKIGFIKGAERQGASLSWKNSPFEQHLNLTTYLGINVFKLTSNNVIHTIEVDGKKHQSQHLDELMSSLVGLTFPTQALSYWIKAIPYNTNDVFTYSDQSKLPATLTSFYNNQHWLIKYSSYKTIQQGEYTFVLPNKIKITSSDLTINIAINNWTI